MKTPNQSVGTTDQVVTTTKSKNAVLGASISYDSLKALEQLMLNDAHLEKLRSEGFRPNKTDLVKMSVSLFLCSKLSRDKLIHLWNNSQDESIFQEEKND
jgi:hypothetical protein